MESKTTKDKGDISRRDFIKKSAVASVAAMAAGVPGAYAAGSDMIKVGLIGCGGRGTYDAKNFLNAGPNVELTAMGDLFQDRLDACLGDLKKHVGDRVKVTPDSCYLGFDAYKKVLATDVDLVILTETPHFRPEHLEAAVEAGKHVFMEKPVAVCPAGVRSVISSSERAEEKGLTIVAGTQMRKLMKLSTVIDRIHDGAIGDVIAGTCLRLGDGMMDWGPKPRRSEWSDMEWQIRRWLFLDWLSGDFVTEMHVHNLDIMNWALGATPVKVTAQGGREIRTAPEYGNSYDHFSAEMEYPNDVRVGYLGRQTDGCSSRNDQRILGSKGHAYLDFANPVIKGENTYRFEGELPSPVIKQHAQQIQAMRNNEKINEGRRIAESSLTAIMICMSAYTGRAISWDWAMKASKLDTRLAEYELGDLPMPPVSVPGKTKLI